MCTVNIKVDSYEREDMMAVCDQRMDNILSSRSATIPNEKVIQLIDEKYNL